MTSLCLIHDGKIVYCLAVNVLNMAVFIVVSVMLDIVGNLIAGLIRGRG